MDKEKPYKLCGCFYAASEEAALVLQEIARDVLGGRGFIIEHVEVRKDGAKIVTEIA